MKIRINPVERKMVQVKALYDDEVTLSNIKPISFDAWHTLITENKSTRINAYIEELLEGVLWAEPEE